MYNEYKSSLIQIQSPSPESAKKKWGFWGGSTTSQLSIAAYEKNDVTGELAQFIVLLKQFTFREMNQINEKRRGLEPLRKRLTSIDNVIPDDIVHSNIDTFFDVVSNVKKVILNMTRGNWVGKLGFSKEYLYMLRKPVNGTGWFGESETSEYGLNGGKTRRKSNRKTRRRSRRKTRRRSRR